MTHPNTAVQLVPIRHLPNSTRLWRYQQKRQALRLNTAKRFPLEIETLGLEKTHHCFDGLLPCAA